MVVSKTMKELLLLTGNFIEPLDLAFHERHILAPVSRKKTKILNRITL